MWAQVGSVNHATGTLGVNIPIYTLTEGNLSVPISLSYDGSGVLVESQASNVGLNWQLNAGGFISREVRGIPDESYSGEVQGYSVDGYPASNEFGMFKDFEPDIFTLSLNGSVIRFIIKPDTENREVIKLNDNTDLKIEIVDQGPYANADAVCNVYASSLERALCRKSWYVGQFVVSTPDGIRYHFGTKSTDREYALTQNSIGQVQSDLGVVQTTTRPIKWYLSSIEFPKGSKDATGAFASAPYQQIQFTYGRSTQRIESLNYNKEFSLATAICDEVPKKTEQQDDVLFLYKCDLKTIESANTVVTFNPGAPIHPQNIHNLIPGFPTPINNLTPYNDTKRKDISPVDFTSGQLNQLGFADKEAATNKALNIIFIKDKATSTLTGFFLYHNYLNEYRYFFNSLPGINEYQRKVLYGARLNLLGVYPIKFVESAIDLTVSELLPGYVFNYNGGLLPEKNSLARDHWGYFNGADYNTDKKIGYRLEGNLVYCDYPRNAVLSPDLSKAKAGALSLVRLPTGGTESYEYELHDSMNYTDSQGSNKVGGLRIKTIRQTDPATQSERTTRLEYTTRANRAISSGVLPVLPTYLADFGGQSYIHVNAYPLMTSRFLSNSYITYGEVMETVEGTKASKTDRQGYTEYEFYNLENTRLASQRTSAKLADLYWWHSDAVLTEEFKRGFPKSSRQYDSQGTLLSEQNWTYQIQNLTDNNIWGIYNGVQGGIHIASEFKLGDKAFTRFVRAFSVGSQFQLEIFVNNVPVYSILVTLLNIIDQWLGNGPQDNSTYRITTYRLPITHTRLIANTGVAYDRSGQNPIETTTRYEYLSPNHRQATNIKNYRSHNNGTVLDELLAETTLVYSRDYKDCSQANASTTALTGLYFRDMNVPIEVVTRRKGRVTGGTFYEYHDKSAGREGLLRTVHSLELSQPLATFSPAGCTMTKHAAYQPTVSITDYNERGLPKLVSSTREGGTTTVGYGVNNYLPTSVSYGTGGKIFTSTREYAVPLWGVSKVQGVSGSFTTVTYDDLGRPLLVKDRDGNLVRSYKYKEANSQ